MELLDALQPGAAPCASALDNGDTEEVQQGYCRRIAVEEILGADLAAHGPGGGRHLTCGGVGDEQQGHGARAGQLQRPGHLRHSSTEANDDEKILAGKIRQILGQGFTRRRKQVHIRPHQDQLPAQIARENVAVPVAEQRDSLGTGNGLDDLRQGRFVEARESSGDVAHVSLDVSSHLVRERLPLLLLAEQIDGGTPALRVPRGAARLLEARIAETPDEARDGGLGGARQLGQLGGRSWYCWTGRSRTCTVLLCGCPKDRTRLPARSSSCSVIF